MLPSPEQKSIIDAISSVDPDTVIRVSAVAGSGKTSTALFIAEAYPDRSILLLTYNRHLSDENHEKAQRRGIHNITMKTFHSFAGKYFGRLVRDDITLIRCLRDMEPVVLPNDRQGGTSFDRQGGNRGDTRGDTLPDYDIIILDEFQDTTEQLFHFDLMLMKTYSHARFILLGDPRQCIYQYNGATSQYMTLFERVTNRKVHDERLSTTYRVPSGIATFVNDVLVKAPHHIDMIAAREGERPVYKVAYTMDAGVRYSVRFVDDAINSGRYKPSDIFILSASAKMKTQAGSASMAACIANQLSSKGHLVALDVEEFSGDHDCTNNKIIVSSIHKSKGRERRLVLFIGLDSGYLKYYKKDYTAFASNVTPSGKIIAPNEIYVACTRASELLVLVAVNTPAPFIRRRRVSSRCISDIEDLNMHFSNNPSADGETFSAVTVTDLVASMPATIKDKIISDTLEIDREYEEDELGIKAPAFDTIRLPSKVKQKKGDVEYVEQVADINGVATTLEAARQEWTMSEVKKAFNDETNGKGLTRRGLLQTAIAIQSTLRQHIYRRVQLDEDEWVPHEKIFALGARIRARLPVDRAEVSMVLLDWRKTCEGMPTTRIDSLSARFDLMYGDDVYEIKTTSEISHDHFIQAAIYRWMLNMGTRKATGEELAIFGSKPVSRQVYHENAFIRRDSDLWRVMRGDDISQGDMPACELIDADDVVVDRITSRREERAAAKKRLDGRFVTFRTSTKGRKDYYGAYYDAETIVDMSGEERETAKVKRVTAGIPSPDGRTLVYNCLTDKLVSITITDAAAFEKLIKMKAAIDDDAIFTAKAAEKIRGISSLSSNDGIVYAARVHGCPPCIGEPLSEDDDDEYGQEEYHAECLEEVCEEIVCLGRDLPPC